MTDRDSMLAVVPDPASPELARTLDLAGYSLEGGLATATPAEHEPHGGWAGAIVDVGTDPDGGWAFLRTVRKQRRPHVSGDVARGRRPARRTRTP